MNGPGETKVFSPSQVETFLHCRRKWAFRYVAGIKTPPHASAQLGDAVHKQLEGYLAGEPLDFTRDDEAGYIAASGLQWLPEPNTPGVAIETSFRLQSPRTGFVWNGRKDVEIDDSRKIPNLTEDGPVPAVLDHKSTSNLRWAKTPDVLLWDVQAVTYAWAVMAERRSPVVDLVWVYYQTKGAKTSKRVHLRMHSEHVGKAFRLIEDVATEMAAIHDKAPAEGREDYVRTLPPNTGACSAYGGCPFEHVCRLTPAERLNAIMSDSIIDSLFARAAEQDGKPVAATAASEELPAWATAPVDPLTARQIAETPPAINPPDLERVAATNLGPAVVLPPAVDTTPAPEPKKRGRPKKEDVATANSVSVPPVVDALPVTGGGQGPNAMTLYVDCYPVGRPAVMLDKYLARAKELVAEQCAAEGKPVADYRFIPFGQGGGALALAVMKALEEKPCDSLVVSTNTREAHDVLSSLVAAADLVVMGAR